MITYINVCHFIWEIKIVNCFVYFFKGHEDCIKMVLPTEEKDFPTGTTRFSEKTQHKLEDSFIETTLVERDITELIQSIHVSSDTAQLPICVGNITLFALIRLYGMIYLQLTHVGLK
jgi:hypothetical protein